MPVGSIERTRVELAGRLRERRGEIEEALLTRTYAIADPKEAADPEYAQGLRAAVSAALDFDLAAVEHGEERAPQVPVLLLAQARLAARNDVPLDTVLRRYFAGYALLGDFIVQEAGAIKLGEAGLKRLLRDQATMFDRFLATVSEEHAREGRAGRGSTEERRAERIERLLEGELVDVSGISYDFAGWHLGIAASGADAERAVRDLAAGLDCRLLLLCREEQETTWAWLGSRRRLESGELLRGARQSAVAGSAVAFGEPGRDLSGWRLSHRQAVAAHLIAQRAPDDVVRYADVALLASMLQDDTLLASLRKLYLVPLEDARDSGNVLRVTLAAYFRQERNSASTAAALCVTRQTVNNRLRAIEERIGRPISSCAGELEALIHLERLSVFPTSKFFLQSFVTSPGRVLPIR